MAGPQVEQKRQHQARPQRQSRSDFSRLWQARSPCQPQCRPGAPARGLSADTGRTRSRRTDRSAGSRPGWARGKGEGRSRPHRDRAGPGGALRRGLAGPGRRFRSGARVRLGCAGPQGGCTGRGRGDLSPGDAFLFPLFSSSVQPPSPPTFPFPSHIPSYPDPPHPRPLISPLSPSFPSPSFPGRRRIKPRGTEPRTFRPRWNLPYGPRPAQRIRPIEFTGTARHCRGSDFPHITLGTPGGSGPGVSPARSPSPPRQPRGHRNPPGRAAPAALGPAATAPRGAGEAGAPPVGGAAPGRGLSYSFQENLHIVFQYINKCVFSITPILAGFKIFFNISAMNFWAVTPLFRGGTLHNYAYSPFTCFPSEMGVSLMIHHHLPQTPPRHPFYSPPKKVQN